MLKRYKHNIHTIIKMYKYQQRCITETCALSSILDFMVGNPHVCVFVFFLRSLTRKYPSIWSRKVQSRALVRIL